MVIKSLEIEPIQYPGAVSNFRAWMDRFISRSAGILLIPPSKPYNEILKTVSMKNDGDIFDFTPFNRQLIIQYSEIDKSSTREVWYATLHDPLLNKNIKPPDIWGTILAVEQYPNKTVVEFMDGIYFRLNTRFGIIELASGKMIGEYFSSLAKFMKDEIENEISRITQATEKESYENSQKSSSNQITINGPVSGSNIIIGNDNKVGTRKRK